MTNNFKVTKNGVELDSSKYTWDEKTKTFSTTENDLILDFSEIEGVTFKTGENCTFNTGWDCVVVRRDVFEFFEIPKNKKIKLNGYKEKGYTEVKD